MVLTSFVLLFALILIDFVSLRTFLFPVAARQLAVLPLSLHQLKLGENSNLVPPCRFDSRQNWLCLLSRTNTGRWARQAWSYWQVRSDREYWPNRTSTSKFACSDACRSILAPCWSQQKKWADKQVMKSLVRCTNKFLREFVRNSEVRQGNFARQVDFEAILC